jgi:hypothetical protein
MKSNITMKGHKVLNLMRAEKHTESSLDSAAHTEIFKQQKQLNDRKTTYLSTLTLNVNGLNCL